MFAFWLLLERADEAAAADTIEPYLEAARVNALAADDGAVREEALLAQQDLELEQLHAHGHSRRHRSDLLRTGYLKPVGGVVVELVRMKQAVQVGN